MSTPIYPIMDNCYMDTYFFFVPSRLLWEHWENMFGENDTNYWAEKTEYSTPTCTIGGTSGLANGSLGDYFGLPTGVKKGIKVNALPARAYAMIYNEWFRDENLEAPLMVGYKKTDEGENTPNPDTLKAESSNEPKNTTSTNEAAIYARKPAKAGKFHDYFTSCLPSPLKSDPVEISLTGNAMLKAFKEPELKTPVNWRANPGQEASIKIQNMAYYVNDSKKIETLSANIDNNSPAVPASFLGADLSGINAISIADLRMSIALQHIFEADARNGTRYREFLSGTWGVTSPDSRLQIPEYIGGQRIAINVNQVVQTSQTDDNRAGTGQYGSIQFDHVQQADGGLCSNRIRLHHRSGSSTSRTQLPAGTCNQVDTWRAIHLLRPEIGSTGRTTCV